MVFNSRGKTLKKSRTLCWKKSIKNFFFKCHRVQNTLFHNTFSAILPTGLPYPIIKRSTLSIFQLYVIYFIGKKSRQKETKFWLSNWYFLPTKIFADFFFNDQLFLYDLPVFFCQTIFCPFLFALFFLCWGNTNCSYENKIRVKRNEITKKMHKWRKNCCWNWLTFFSYVVFYF